MKELQLLLRDLKRYKLVNLSNYESKFREEVLSQIDLALDLPVHYYTPQTHPIIAIDMDNTIWTENYPHFGEVYPHAIEVINDMVDAGYEVIIWTSRGGSNMDECRQHLINEYGLRSDIKWNEHSPFYTSQYEIQSPKIAASIYIDDRSFNAPVYKNYWPMIRQYFIHNEEEAGEDTN